MDTNFMGRKDFKSGESYYVNKKTFTTIKQAIIKEEIEVNLNTINWQAIVDSPDARNWIEHNALIPLYHYMEDRSKENFEYVNSVIDYYICKVYADRVSCKAVDQNLAKEKVDEMVSKIKVGMTYPFSITTFKEIYPGIQIIKNIEEVSNYDLIIVPGGEDISPSYYNESNKGLSECNSARDEQEIPLVKSAINMRKKLLGICRGHQLINILNGCIYHQDIFNEGFTPHPSYHELNLVYSSGTVIGRFFGNKRVVSLHHQGLSTCKLFISSTYNGIVESTEGNNIITTQFHPEFQADNDRFFEYIKYWALNLSSFFK